MQTARGTSVTTSDPVPPARSRLLLWSLFGAVALVAYVIDLVTKILAVEKLTDRPDVELVGTVLQLHLTRNPGAAFSTGTEFTPVLTVIAIVAALVVLWFARRIGSIGWAIGLGFLLAGITGNLTDRLFRAPEPFHGHVVDFLMLPNWPIFNIADVCINVAAAVIVVQALRGVRLDGSRDTDDEPGEDAVEETTATTALTDGPPDGPTEVPAAEDTRESTGSSTSDEAR